MEWLPLIAQETTGGQGGGWTSMLMIMGIMFLMLWFVMIRPQRKRDQQRREMLGALNKNDKVLTSGGMYGTITSIKEDRIVLRVDDANNVRVTVHKGAIMGIDLPPKDRDGTDRKDSRKYANDRK